MVGGLRPREGHLVLDEELPHGIEFDDPEALTRRYEYYDPIYTLPEEGQAWWRDKMHEGLDDLLAELAEQQGIDVHA